jgi:hypothetical protein
LSGNRMASSSWNWPHKNQTCPVFRCLRYLNHKYKNSVKARVIAKAQFLWRFKKQKNTEKQWTSDYHTTNYRKPQLNGLINGASV